jgi:hypothetical protein
MPHDGDNEKRCTRGCARPSLSRKSDGSDAASPNLRCQALCTFEEAATKFVLENQRNRSLDDDIV